MAIIKNVAFAGGKTTSTLTGNIELNQQTGELLVRRGGRVLTRINSQGFTYSDAQGLRRILIGAHPSDGHIIEAISNPGIDVIDELGG